MGERQTILVVDDNETSREILNAIFSDEFEVKMASTGKEALTTIARSGGRISAVLLDINMPEIDGFGVLASMKNAGLLDRIAVLMITADTTVETEKRCYMGGAQDVLWKPFDSVIIKTKVKRAVALMNQKRHMEEQIEDQTKLLRQQYHKLKEQESKLRETNQRIIDTVCEIVEYRNLETGNHLKRIKGFTKILAETAMRLYPEYGLDAHRIEVIINASAMHDIGKITISDTILLKPGKLTTDEFELMKAHTTKGCEIVRMLSGISDKEYFETSYDICRHHHERYDGHGYPDGLYGDNISIAAQLTSIADVYDALINDRVYKRAVPVDKAFEMIQNGECGVFSPKILNCLTVAKSEMEAFFALHKDDVDEEEDE